MARILFRMTSLRAEAVAPMRHTHTCQCYITVYKQKQTCLKSLLHTCLRNHFIKTQPAT